MSRRPAYVVALVAVAVIGAVAGVWLALASGSGDGSGTGAASHDPTTASARTSPASASGTPTATPTALEQVFPSMTGQSCAQDTQSEATGVPGRLRRWRCTADYAGTTATIFYSEWTTSTAAVSYSDSWAGGTYARTGGTDRAGEGFLRWAGTNEGSYKLTWTYLDAPYSVTVALPLDERPTTDEVLASGLIELEPPQDVAPGP